jgi:hypothetical protein
VAWAAEQKAQAAILRDTVGNPFRPVTLPPGPLAETGELPPAARFKRGPSPRLTRDVVTLAEAAYRDRRDDGTLDPLTLAALADALEEAGCVEVAEEGREVWAMCSGCNGHGKDTGSARYPEEQSDCFGCGGSGDVKVMRRGRIQKTHPLLAALRDTGPHYRGFWALDLLLGKG